MSNDSFTPESLAQPVPTIKKKTVWAWTVATFLGAGYGKPGPGTWGSVAAVLLWSAFAFTLRPSTLTLALALTIGIAVATVLGVPAATIVERQSGRTDPGFVVIDEVIGQWLWV